jgi:hypothetical protein
VRDELLGVMKENGFSPHFVASDGDNGLNSAHEDAWMRYSEIGKTDLREILNFPTDNWQKDFDNWPISDLLHLVKKARLRLVKGKLAFQGGSNDTITAKTVRKNPCPEN